MAERQELVHARAGCEVHVYVVENGYGVQLVSEYDDDRGFTTSLNN